MLERIIAAPHSGTSDCGARGELMSQNRFLVHSRVGVQLGHMKYLKEQLDLETFPQLWPRKPKYRMHFLDQKCSNKQPDVLKPRKFLCNFCVAPPRPVICVYPSDSPKNLFFVRFEWKIVVGGGFMTEELKTRDDKSDSRGNSLLIKTLLSWNRKSRKFISEKLVAVSRVDKIRKIFHFICHLVTWFIFKSAALSRALLYIQRAARDWPLVIASTPLSPGAIADSAVGGA